MASFTSKLLSSKQLAPDVFHYEFDSENTFAFKAGQFVMLKVKDDQEKQVNRSYSIASPIRENGGFALCVKLVEGGRASEYLRQAQVGDEFEFMGPFGHFTLKESMKDILMLATGTGIAPFMGMLPTLFEAGFSGSIRLILGVRTREDLIYVDELEAFERAYENFKFLPSLSQPDAEWTGLSGRLTEHLPLLEMDHENTMIYICGNGQMVKDARQILLDRAVPKDAIALEQFNPA